MHTFNTPAGRLSSAPKSEALTAATDQGFDGSNLASAHHTQDATGHATSLQSWLACIGPAALIHQIGQFAGPLAVALGGAA